MEIEKSYEKFVWAGILWLIVAEIAMMVFTVQESFTGVPVSHALIGAYRHAVTVGFITMMIFGFASRIIPISQGIKLHSYSLLLWTFILINAGSAIKGYFSATCRAYGISACLPGNGNKWSYRERGNTIVRN